jgi:hypothetical protein
MWSQKGYNEIYMANANSIGPKNLVFKIKNAFEILTFVFSLDFFRNCIGFHIITWARCMYC